MTRPPSDAAIELVLPAKTAVLPGDLQVKRAIPQRQRRMVGPFTFLDQMGPARIPEGRSSKVLSHPHIGLSTLTYLFEGEGLHQDSLGVVQPILPGAVNWMTAGRGIVHAETMKGGAEGRLLGVQFWVALPRDQEECDPSFAHYDASDIPEIVGGDARIRLIAGSMFGATSPVKTSSPLFAAEVNLPAGSMVTMPAGYAERAAYVVEGAIDAGGQPIGAGEMVFYAADGQAPLLARESTRLLLVGGEPLESPRYINWNFVSSSRDRLQQAREDWREQRFPKVPGETEYIPLPDDPLKRVNYP